jgi:hypothetical protein
LWCDHNQNRRTTLANLAQKHGIEGETVVINLAASATTDGCEATFQVTDSAGAAVAGVFAIEAWISESAAGAGLTADAASGALTAVSNKGTILTALTAKKHVSAVTNSAGLLTLLIVDSVNPTDQYFACKVPATGRVVVSAASGTSWQGV